MTRPTIPFERRTQLSWRAAALTLAWIATAGVRADAAGVNPSTLNPYVYLDANAGVTSGGINSPVTAWQDQSSNSFAFQANHPNAASNDPTLVVGPNGNLAIALDGSDLIDSDANLQFFTADDSAMTIFTVMKADALPGSQQFLINHAPGEAGDSFEMGPDSGQVQSPGAWGIHRGSGLATSTASGALAAGQFYVITTEINSVGEAGSNVAFFVDGAYSPNASTGWTSPGSYATGSDPLAVGARVDNKGEGFDTLTPNGFFAGAVASIVIVREQLSTSDRQGVEEFLGNKYGIAVSQSVALPPIIPPPGLQTIGDELIVQPSHDGDIGGVYIYGGEPFDEIGTATEFSFVGTIAGRAVTPLLVEIVSGSIGGNDAVFSITGVGQSIVSTGGSSPQSTAFNVVAGSDAVTPAHVFGYFDGTVQSDGSGGINILSRNQGTVDFRSDSNGDWAFSGGGQVPFDFDVDSDFASAVTTGGDGSSGNPIRVFSRSDGNGRVYSAQMTAVPEPASAGLIASPAFIVLVASARRRRRMR